MTEAGAPEPDVATDDAARPAIGVGPIVALAGGILLAVSSWLAWLNSFELPGAVGRSEPFSGYDTPARFLVDNDADLGGPSIGVLVLVVGTVALVGAIVRGAEPLALLAGVLGAVVGGLYVFQLSKRVDVINDELGLDASLTDLLGVGAYVAFLGGIAAIVGAVLALLRRM